MPVKKRPVDSLIKKFLSGKTTPEETEELKNWWKSSLTGESHLDTVDDEEWELLKREMEVNIHTALQGHAAQQTTAVPEISVRRSGWDRTGWRIAASLLLLLTAAAALYYYDQRDVVVTTAFGERRTIVLPDGSTITLNGNSSIRYAQHWKPDEDRLVRLEGEAFFSVKHTLHHSRFSVQSSNNLMIEVLGTQFDVINRCGETNVILQEGSVRLVDARSTYTMKPNEMVSHSKGNPEFVMKRVEVAPKVSWKSNLLIYENEPVGTILNKLSQSHGLKVVYGNDSIRDEIFNGSVPADSVTMFFEKIQKLYGVTVTLRDDDTYVIQ